MLSKAVRKEILTHGIVAVVSFTLTALVIFATVGIISCVKSNAAVQLPPRFAIEPGRYEMTTASITNLRTEEITEIAVMDVISDKEWKWLFGFSIDLNSDTKFYAHKDCYAHTKGGLVYELIADNTLRLHFERWNGYDIAIILKKAKVYG